MKFLVTGYLPENFDPSTITEEAGQKLHALNAEMEAAGVLVLAGGLAPAVMTKTVQRGPSGTALVTDGPYLEAKEHIGGFMIIEAASEEEALDWVRKGAEFSFGPVEVRQIFFNEG